MPTALAATFQPGTALLPARVLLQVTGAPSLTPSYQSNFSASVDGWTGSAGTALAFNQGTNVALRITGQSGSGATSTFSKTVSGLTIGQTYRFSAMVQTVSGSISLSVSGVSPQGTLVFAGTRAAASYSFIATATSHVLVFTVKAPKQAVGAPAPAGQALVDTVLLIRSSGWQGTTIRRTDDNGTNVVVRENDGGQDATGVSGSATMTVTDYEAALSGPVSYTVTDGNGATAVAALAAPTTPGVWLTLPATAVPGVPTAPTNAQIELVTGLSESSGSNGSVHVIIGRADPIVNPGPLATRQGSMTLFCLDYTTAKKVRTMLAGGLVALLRQPTFPGLDVYLYARNVRLEPSPEATEPRRWLATVDYVEVAAP